MGRLSIVFLLLITLGCGIKSDDNKSADNRPFVAVVNYPLYHFAKSIGGDLITVYFPVIEGDPAYWKPDARQIRNFQKADLILDNGAGYAAWMEKVSLPSSRIINTSGDFMDEWIEIEEVTTHSHGPEGEHVHKGTASTTWLNFKFAQKQASAALNALIKLLPDHEALLRKNYEQLETQLNDFDDRMRRMHSILKNKELIASHPVYQYLEAAYGLSFRNMHWEPGEMPTEDQWMEFDKSLTKSIPRIIFWEEEPLPEVKHRLVESGVKVVVFNPCGNKPGSGDFISTMEQNVSGLALILGE